VCRGEGINDRATEPSAEFVSDRAHTGTSQDDDFGALPQEVVAAVFEAVECGGAEVSHLTDQPVLLPHARELFVLSDMPNADTVSGEPVVADQSCVHCPGHLRPDGEDSELLCQPAGGLEGGLTRPHYGNGQSGSEFADTVVADAVNKDRGVARGLCTNSRLGID
jgi:hypothetical protein